MWSETDPVSAAADGVNPRMERSLENSVRSGIRGAVLIQRDFCCEVPPLEEKDCPVTDVAGGRGGWSGVGFNAGGEKG